MHRIIIYPEDHNKCVVQLRKNDNDEWKELCTSYLKATPEEALKFSLNAIKISTMDKN